MKNSIKRLIAAVSVGALCLGGASLAQSPAQAATDFSQFGWWNNTSGNGSAHPHTEWTYPDYPLECNNDPSLPAYKVYWITPSDRPDIVAATKLGQYPTETRDYFRRAASAFAASASSYGANLADHTPRFVTKMNGQGECVPDFTLLEVPETILKEKLHNSNPDYNLWDWMDDNGYGPTSNRKALSIIQYGLAGTNGPGVGYGGIAQVYDNYFERPGANNYNNIGSHLSVNLISKPDASWFDSPKTLVHEMAHSTGAILYGDPNENPQNDAHPFDCKDVLCYGGYAGEVNVCGAGKAVIRLDCNKDTYFNPAVDPDTQTKWWASSSSFLWGNETFLHPLNESTATRFDPAPKVGSTVTHADPVDPLG